MTTDSCLVRFNQIKKSSKSEDDYQKACRAEFVTKSVISSWGNMRQYVVKEIDFKSTPSKHHFEYNGAKISVT